MIGKVPVCEYLHTVGKTHVCRCSKAPRPGVYVFDEKGSVVGRVIDVFGPVNKPYVAITGTRLQKYFVRMEDLVKI